MKNKRRQPWKSRTKISTSYIRQETSSRPLCLKDASIFNDLFCVIQRAFEISSLILHSQIPCSLKVLHFLPPPFSSSSSLPQFTCIFHTHIVHHTMCFYIQSLDMIFPLKYTNLIWKEKFSTQWFFPSYISSDALKYVEQSSSIFMNA